MTVWGFMPWVVAGPSRSLRKNGLISQRTLGAISHHQCWASGVIWGPLPPVASFTRLAVGAATTSTSICNIRVRSVRCCRSLTTPKADAYFVNSGFAFATKDNLETYAADTMAVTEQIKAELLDKYLEK